MRLTGVYILDYIKPCAEAFRGVYILDNIHPYALGMQGLA